MCERQVVKGSEYPGNCSCRSMCAVDGRWSEWSVWDECSVTCGQGQRSRTRECNNPSPAYGGRMCNGDWQEFDRCNITPCPGNRN